MGLFYRVLVQSFDEQSRNRPKVMGLCEIREIIGLSCSLFCPPDSNKAQRHQKSVFEADEKNKETRCIFQG